MRRYYVGICTYTLSFVNSKLHSSTKHTFVYMMSKAIEMHTLLAFDFFFVNWTLRLLLISFKLPQYLKNQLIMYYLNILFLIPCL